MGSIVGHRIDYDGVGVPRPAAHTQQNLTQVPPPPPEEKNHLGKDPMGDWSKFKPIGVERVFISVKCYSLEERQWNLTLHK